MHFGSFDISEFLIPTTNFELEVLKLNNTWHKMGKTKCFSVNQED